MSETEYFNKTTVRSFMTDCGVTRANDDAVEMLTEHLEKLAIQIVRKTREMVRHANRKKWMDKDVQLAAKLIGIVHAEYGTDDLIGF